MNGGLSDFEEGGMEVQKPQLGTDRHFVAVCLTNPEYCTRIVIPFRRIMRLKIWKIKNNLSIAKTQILHAM